MRRGIFTDLVALAVLILGIAAAGALFDHAFLARVARGVDALLTPLHGRGQAQEVAMLGAPHGDGLPTPIVLGKSAPTPRDEVAQGGFGEVRCVLFLL